jgi:hypothetical protein
VPQSLTDLKRIYDRCLAYARGADSADDMSEFWAEILAGRKSFPDFNEMLVMRRGFTYPLADRAKVGDEAAERAYAMAAHHVVSRDVPAAFLSAAEEPATGCPIAFDFGPYTLSAGGLVNALTAFRIVSWCERLGLGQGPLSILEIGAGYGQVAVQLHGCLDIARYAVCDLPENGFLGAFYLQANLPGAAAAYMERDRFDGEPDARLLFAPPSALDRLDGPYHLILNSYSFQEMTRASVEAYLRHAAQTLSDDGILYSLNAHGKAGIEHPHQYRAAGLQLVSIRSVRRFPWQLFGTVPYEFIQRRGATGVVIEDDHVDAIGRAMQLGLHDELDLMCDALCNGRLTTEQSRWLSQAARLLGPGDTSARLMAGSAMLDLGVEPEVSAYLTGTLEFVRGARPRAAELLSAALDGLGESAARQRALLMLAALQSARGNRAEAAPLAAQAKALAPHLGPEVDRWKSDRDGLVEMLAWHLAVPADGWSSRVRLWRSRARGIRRRLAHNHELRDLEPA